MYLDRIVHLYYHGSRRSDMRAVDCPCGHRLEGEDDEELFRKAREHVDRDHPEMQRSDEELRQRIAADAYDVQAA
jgi:predicted small metal-binding protein